jgi:hypothetical protein
LSTIQENEKMKMTPKLGLTACLLSDNPILGHHTNRNHLPCSCSPVLCRIVAEHEAKGCAVATNPCPESK